MIPLPVPLPQGVHHSPRIRGDDPRDPELPDDRRDILPVFAGMIPLVPRVRETPQHSPRIRGDDPRPTF